MTFTPQRGPRRNRVRPTFCVAGGRDRMSALGQAQTLGKARLLSAFPARADIGTQSRNVCFVPKADIVNSTQRLFPVSGEIMGAPWFRKRPLPADFRDWPAQTRYRNGSCRAC